MLPIIILAGGRGSRMKSWTNKIPKSMIPVLGRPFIDWQLEWLKSLGVERIVLSIGYRGEQIVEHVGNGDGLGVSYCEDHDQPGTGGALRQIVEWGNTGPFGILYGDSYLPGLDIDEFYGWENTHRAVSSTDGTNWIDHGFTVIDNPSFLMDYQPPFSLNDAVRDEAQRGRLHLIPVNERFYEIGSPQGLRDLEEHLR